MIISWIRDHASLFMVVGIVSAGAFFVTLAIVPMLIARIPADYFARRSNAGAKATPGRFILGVLKNLFGIVVTLAGFAMLVLPGQGLLTMLIGLLLIDFPGKRRLELRLIRVPQVHRAANWIRRQAGKAPLLMPGEESVY